LSATEEIFVTAMELETLQQIVATNLWSAILPEIFLGCLAVVLLFVDLLYPRHRELSGRIAFWAVTGLLLVLSWRYLGHREAFAAGQLSFSGMIYQDTASEWMRLFFVFCAAMVCHLGSVFLRNRPLAKVEYYHTVLVVTAGLMLLAQSHDFLLLFVVLETVTVGFYVLVSYARNSQFSLEAGLKFLIMAGFSSAIMLFGIVLLYGVAGNPNLPMTAVNPLNFADLGAFIAGSDSQYGNTYNLMVTAGAALVIIGIAFKIGAVPFQVWIPDVYQGAPTPVTAFLAVGSKAAGFIMLFLLLKGPFVELGAVLVPLLTVIAILTLIFGNIAALGQRNVKRVMGMSGVAHAGVLLMGVIASLSVPWAFTAVMFYLLVYALGSFAVFSVMAHVGPSEDSDLDQDHFDALIQQQPYLGSVLVIGLGSLAGIPPLAGFVAKLLIFFAAFQAGLYAILGVALVGVVISIYYYFSWIRAAVMKNPFLEEDREPVFTTPRFSAKVIMGLLTLGTIMLGLYQGFFHFG